MRRIDLIVVHCSASQASTDIGVAEIRRMHQELGWRDVGYHRVIRRSGLIENGMPVGKPGIHAKGYNRNSLAVCLVGGINPRGEPENNFTPEQFMALDEQISIWMEAYPGAQLCGHRDLSPDLNGDGRISPNEWVKACPSFNVRAWWEARSARTLAPLVLV